VSHIEDINILWETGGRRLFLEHRQDDRPKTPSVHMTNKIEYDALGPSSP
jgi:hypothetical protein